MPEEEELELDFGEDDIFQPNQTITRSPTPPRIHDSTLDERGNKLIEGWISRVSASKGDIYYKNVLTGIASWTIPKERSPTPPLPTSIPVTLPEVVTEVKPVTVVKAGIHPDRQKFVSRTSHQDSLTRSSEPVSRFRSDPSFNDTSTPQSPIESNRNPSTTSQHSSRQPPSRPRPPVHNAPTGPKALNNHSAKVIRTTSPPLDAPHGPRKSFSSKPSGSSQFENRRVSDNGYKNVSTSEVPVEVNHHLVTSGPNQWGTRASGKSVLPPNGPKNPYTNSVSRTAFETSSHPPSGPRASISSSDKFNPDTKRDNRAPRVEDLDAALDLLVAARSPHNRSRSRSFTPPPPVSITSFRRKSLSPVQTRMYSSNNVIPQDVAQDTEMPRYRHGKRSYGILPPLSPPPEFLSEKAMEAMRRTYQGRVNLVKVLQDQEEKKKSREIKVEGRRVEVERRENEIRNDGNRNGNNNGNSIVPVTGNNWARVKPDNQVRGRSRSPERFQPSQQHQSYQPSHHQSSSRPPVTNRRHSRSRSRSRSPPRSRRPISPSVARRRSASPPPHSHQRRPRSRSPTPPPSSSNNVSYSARKFRGNPIDTYRPGNPTEVKGNEVWNHEKPKFQGSHYMGQSSQFIIPETSKGKFRVIEENKDDRSRDNSSRSGYNGGERKNDDDRREFPPHLPRNNSSSSSATSNLPQHPSNYRTTSYESSNHNNNNNNNNNQSHPPRRSLSPPLPPPFGTALYDQYIKEKSGIKNKESFGDRREGEVEERRLSISELAMLKRSAPYGAEGKPAPVGGFKIKGGSNMNNNNNNNNSNKIPIASSSGTVNQWPARSNSLASRLSLPDRSFNPNSAKRSNEASHQEVGARNGEEDEERRKRSKAE